MDQIETRTGQEEDTISLLDLISVIAKHRRFIFFSTVFAAFLVVLRSTIDVESSGKLTP